MKPELGRSYPPDWQGYPPHMAPNDVPLWQRFRAANAARFTAFFYDVALGDGTDPGPDQAPEYRYGFIRLTRLRADALGVRPDGWTLFEVRPSAGAGALGALVSYRALWLSDPPDARPLESVLITDVVKAELRPIFASEGITIVTV